MRNNLYGTRGVRVGVILDLDLTLIDSSIAAEMRQQRRWQDVYSLVPQFRVYPGITQLLQGMAANGVPVAIVTTSPRPYCQRVMAQHGLTVAHVTCYHDTKLHKPEPDPIRHAVEQLNVSPSRVVSIGDDPKDIVASRSAGVISVGATWGCIDTEALRNANPDHLVESPAEAQSLIEQILGSSS